MTVGDTIDIVKQIIQVGGKFHEELETMKKLCEYTCSSMNFF